MRENQYPEKEKLSAVQTIRLEMQEKVRRLAMPCEPGEGVKSCLRRVSRLTGLDQGEVKRIWYGEWRRIPADIADRIREATEAHERRLDQELAALRQRHAALYGLAHHGADPEFYRGRAGLDDR